MNTNTDDLVALWSRLSVVTDDIEEYVSTRLRAAPAVQGAGDDFDPKETVGQLASRVGAWETPEGFVSFGSWMALAAFHHHTLTGVAKQRRQMEAARAALSQPAGQQRPTESIGNKVYKAVAAQMAAPAEQAQGVSDAPVWCGKARAMELLNRVELAQGGANGPTIQLRAHLATIPAQPTAAVREGFKLLKTTTHDERSWPEDYSHENGNYCCECCVCGRMFQGHKRRVCCKVCDSAALTPAPTEAPAAPEPMTGDELEQIWEDEPGPSHKQALLAAQAARDAQWIASLAGKGKS